MATYVKEIQKPAPIYLPQGILPYYVGTALMTKDDIISQLPVKISRLGVITSGPEEEVVIKGFEKVDSKSFGSLKFILLKQSPSSYQN